MPAVLVACDDCGHRLIIQAPTAKSPDLPQHRCDPRDRTRFGQFVVIAMSVKNRATLK